MKTILEATKDPSINRGLLMSSISQISDVSFASGVKFAQQWISVEEKEKWADVNNILLKDESGGVWTYNEYCKEAPFVIITHWRPIEIK